MFNADESGRSIPWQIQVDDLAKAVRIFQQHNYKHQDPKKYWEKIDGWEKQVWSPNIYRINLEGHTMQYYRNQKP